MTHEPSDVFDRVHGDADIWTKILSFLPLPDLKMALATTHFHRSLSCAARCHVQWLTVAILPGVGAEMGEDHELIRPKFNCAENDVDLLPSVNIPTVSVSSRCQHLAKICACYADLTRLQLFLGPGARRKEDSELDDNEIDESSGKYYGVERLVDVANWLGGRATSNDDEINGRAGCAPQRLLQLPKVHTLELIDESAGGEEGYDEAVAYADGWRTAGSLLLVCALSCWRTLTRLNLSGVGPLCMDAHLSIELPQLLTLQLGEFDGISNRGSGNFGVPYKEGALGELGVAFPTLTGLDVGYASFIGGVSFADVERLLTSARSLQHLDLSQVMTYIDFGPALRLLARHASGLRSLATHGLMLPHARLLELAHACPQLERLHLVAMHRRRHESDVSEGDELLTFLRACPRLVHLDISLGVVPQPQMLTWLEERQQQRIPVLSLVLAECSVAGGVRDDTPVRATSMRKLKYAKRLEFKERAIAISPGLRVNIAMHADAHECHLQTDPNDPRRGRTRMFANIIPDEVYKFTVT